jgi:MFS family permease
MLGGGMTPVLAAGFNEVAASYKIAEARVSLTTGLYMMGLGIGSVIMSPTAILFGKRPVYLATSIMFILASVWCALSPDFPSLIVARIVQGISVSPVECLPSATVAEIFFLHERAYRLGVYTLLLLGGKNLIPLVSAVVIQALGWRWVFWVVAFVVGFGACLLFLFVPETFWDRTPRPKHITRPHRVRSNSQGSGHHMHLPSLFHRTQSRVSGVTGVLESPVASPGGESMGGALQHRKTRNQDAHVAFDEPGQKLKEVEEKDFGEPSAEPANVDGSADTGTQPHHIPPISPSDWHHPRNWSVQEGPVQDEKPNPTPELHNLNSPYYVEKAGQGGDYFSLNTPPTIPQGQTVQHESEVPTAAPTPSVDPLAAPTPLKKHVTLSSIDTTTEKDTAQHHHVHAPPPTGISEAPTDVTEHSSGYTNYYRNAPAKSFLQSLAPYHGRLSKDKWLKVAIRPFILFAYPAVLWSAMVYALSVGWLIVLSESVSVVYKNRASYNFSSLQVGLVYVSPLIGGILGTVVAGKVSDYIVRFMARRNDGIYEPEFRLVMALPVAVATTIGLMGFGWSAQERDAWIVPTFFFGIISFGCTLGSTTAITFCVDSYRQYAGEALVTLNFSKSKSLPPLSQYLKDDC